MESKTIYLVAAEEIMINSGKEINYNYFDQNRASVGFGYKLNEALNMSVAYMNVFIQRNSVLNFENNDVIVVNLYFSLNLSKKNVSNE